MLCPKCGKEGIEPGDAFCRHCGFSLTTRTSVAEGAGDIAEKKRAEKASADATRRLLRFGGAIIILAGLAGLIAAHWIEVSDFSTTVLLLAGGLTLVGLVMMFVGFERRHVH